MTLPGPPDHCSSHVFSSLLMRSLLYKVLCSSFLLVQALLYRVEPCFIIHKLGQNRESYDVQRLLRSLFRQFALIGNYMCITYIALVAGV